MTTRRTRFERRERFERRAMQENLLIKSMNNMREAVDDLQDVDVFDIDEVVSGLEAVEKELGRAKRRVERLQEGDDR